MPWFHEPESKATITSAVVPDWVPAALGTDSTDAMLIASAELQQRGKGNLGIYQHTLRRRSGETILIVEKRVPNAHKQEIAVSTELWCRSKTQASQEGCPLPVVHSIARRGKHTAVFMPHYSGLGLRLKNGGNYGRLLAGPLLKLARSDLSLSSTNATIQELRESFGFAFAFRRCLWRPSYMALHARAIGLCMKSLPLLGKIPVVISHNDLHNKNICLTSQSKHARVTFLDLGLISMNYAGADLCHLLRKSTTKRYWQHAYKTALHDYSLGMHCDPSLLSLAAHCYALLRWLKTCRAAIEKQESNQQISDKLVQATRLSQSHRALLQGLS